MSKKCVSMNVCNGYEHVFNLSSGNLPRFFELLKPDYFNAGKYGWNCDLYVDYWLDTIIVSGYRNTRGVVPKINLKDWDIKVETKSQAELLFHLLVKYLIEVVE